MMTISTRPHTTQHTRTSVCAIRATMLELSRLRSVFITLPVYVFAVHGKYIRKKTNSKIYDIQVENITHRRPPDRFKLYRQYIYNVFKESCGPFELKLVLREKTFPCMQYYKVSDSRKSIHISDGVTPGHQSETVPRNGVRGLEPVLKTEKKSFISWLVAVSGQP